MRHLLLDALAVENGKTGVGQYIHELLDPLLSAAPVDMDFTVMINTSVVENHPFVEMIKRHPNARLLRKDIPAIGLKRDLLFWKYRKEFSCDLFHCLYSNHPLFFKGKQMVTIHDLKYIVHPEYMGSKGAAKSLYLRKLMHNAASRCEKLIAVSKSTKNDLLKKFPGVKGLDEKTRVIYEGATVSMAENKEIFKKFNLDKPYFLYLGELRPHKNVKRLVEAFIRFKKHVEGASDVHLIIAGKPHKSFDMKEIAGRKDIIVTGYVQDEDKYTLYSNALAYCLPSLYEGFGLPILEAMKCGTAVLTSDFSSTAEVAGNAAKLVDPLDPADIAWGMKKIFTDEKYRNTLIERGYAREKEFSWKKAAEETLAVYKEILG